MPINTSEKVKASRKSHTVLSCLISAESFITHDFVGRIPLDSVRYRRLHPTDSNTVSETGAVSPSPTPEMCETGVSWPSLATEQDKSETGVSSPGPSTNRPQPRSPTRDSWNNSWDRYDYRDKWTDVWKDGHDGNRWIHGWKEDYHDDNWTDAWRERNSGYVRQHDDDNSTDARNKCKSDDEWRASHWETSSWSSSHLETSGWNDADECSDDRKGQQWSNHSFFETMNVDQLINSFGRGDDDAATFAGIEVDPGESLADTAAQSGSTFVHFGRPKRLSSTSLDSNRVSSQGVGKG